MSEIQANKLSPASGTALQVGDSGDTITIPSGATLTNSGTATGFGGSALTNDFRMSLFYANDNQTISANTGTTISGNWTNSNITARLIVNPSNASVTESSGIFTFAATGYYLITAKLNGNMSDYGNAYFYLESTDNNSSYSDALDWTQGVQEVRRNFTFQMTGVLKIEDTSNDKVKFTVYYEEAGGQVNGNGTRLRTSAQFIKIADI